MKIIILTLFYLTAISALDNNFPNLSKVAHEFNGQLHLVNKSVILKKGNHIACHIVDAKVSINKRKVSIIETGADEIYTPNMGHKSYKYFPTTEIGTPYKGCFSFKTNADKEALVSLSNAAQYSDPQLNFLIGGWVNTKSAIFKNENVVTDTPTPNILSGAEYRSFWIKWDNGKVEIGRKGQSSFLQYYNSQLYPFNFVGILTTWGGSGSWIFEESNCPGYNNITPTENEFDVKCVMSPERNQKINNSTDILMLYKAVLDEINFDFQYYMHNRHVENLSTKIKENLNNLYDRLKGLNVKAWIALENGEINGNVFIESKKMFNEIEVMYFNYLAILE